MARSESEAWLDMEMQSINDMDVVAFVARFGGVFEHSPWVAERAFAARPFADLQQLHAAMVAVVRAASRDEQLALLRAHPDLAGKEAQQGTMTASSVSEQSAAGLDRLSAAEMKLISELNAAYRARHGFPFIIAVRHYTKEGVLHEFARRLANDSPGELEAGLQQIQAITRLRLERMFSGTAPGAARAAASTAA
jgi:2-oxo-4-hydroxy-4-carboxy-5-ureidoimidazoline decarboxylase